MVMMPAGDNAQDARLRAVLERGLQSTFAPGVDARAHVAVTRTADGNEIRVAYRHTDPQRAQATLQTLMSRVVEANIEVAAPPGRSAGQIKIVSPSDLPATASRPLLAWLAASGAGTGALLGLAIGAVRRRRHP